jgi:hypothetical protein
MRRARAYPGRIFELSNFEKVEKSHSMSTQARD